MKSLALIALLLIMNLPLIAAVNGHVEEVNGITVLTIWGTHPERGYAHGYLLGERIKTLFDDYWVKSMYSNSAQAYSDMRTFFTNNYIIEDKYQAQADSMLQGLLDSGVDLYNPILERDIDATDILTLSAIPDLYQSGAGRANLGCSSLTSWGSSTQDDSSLAGHLIITRLMDWFPDTTAYKSNALIVSIPSEEDEQKICYFAFVGMVGVLSGINESGVATFMHVGYETDHQLTEPFYPIWLSMRNGLEAKDYNKDDEHTPEDLVRAIQERNRSGASIIDVVLDEGSDSAPLVIECNNERGVSVRDHSNNTQVPGDHLAATNDFRLLYDPSGCVRYDGIVDSLTNSTDMTPERSWAILRDAAGLYNNLQAMQYIPFSNQLRLTASNQVTLAHSQEPVEFDLADIFSYRPTSITREHSVSQGNLDFRLDQNYPNPFNPTTTIRYGLPEASDVSLIVNDVTGREVSTLVSHSQAAGWYEVQWNGEAGDGILVGTGVYFARIQAGSFSKVIKMVYLR